MANEIDFSKIFSIPVPAKQDMKAPIIIVDDQSDVRLIISHHLSKLTFSSVLQASDVYDAINLLETNPSCSMVLCDANMPQMGANDFLEEMKNRIDLARVPFCVMMDTPSREKLMLAVENGVDEILAKPFTFQDLTIKMSSCFRNFHNPRNPEKVYELAKSYLKAKQPAEALKVYEALHAAAPNSVRPLLGLARVAAMQGKQDDAMRLVERGVTTNPNFVPAWVLKAELELQAKNMGAAVESYKKAINLSPLNPVRYKTAADMLFKLQRYPEAVEILEVANQNKVQFKELNHYLSQAYFMVKDYAKALKFIKSAVLNDPENISFLNQLGICLKETSQWDEAAKIYNQIIKLDPENRTALYNKSILLYNKGQKDEALKLLERVVRKHPDFAQAAAKLKEYQRDQQQSA